MTTTSTNNKAKKHSLHEDIVKHPNDKRHVATLIVHLGGHQCKVKNLMP